MSYIGQLRKSIGHAPVLSVGATNVNTQTQKGIDYENRNYN